MGLEKFWPDLEILFMVSLEVSFCCDFASRSLDFFVVSASNFETWVSQSRKVSNLQFYTPTLYIYIYRLGEIFCDIKPSCDLAIYN